MNTSTAVPVVSLITGSGSCPASKNGFKQLEFVQHYPPLNIVPFCVAKHSESDLLHFNGSDDSVEQQISLRICDMGLKIHTAAAIITKSYPHIEVHTNCPEKLLLVHSRFICHCP
jgi:hypothetical protein